MVHLLHERCLRVSSRSYVWCRKARALLPVFVSPGATSWGSSSYIGGYGLHTGYGLRTGYDSRGESSQNIKTSLLDHFGNQHSPEEVRGFPHHSKFKKQVDLNLKMEKMDFSSQLPQLAVSQRKKESDAKAAQAKAVKDCEDAVIMTAAEDEEVKNFLDHLEELSELSIKEATFVNENTVKMACGAPLEREGLRFKAATAIKLRAKAVLGVGRIIHDEPGLVQSFCAMAVKGTMISVNEVANILSAKTES